MADDKKISPKQAAAEVLKKFLSLAIKAETKGKTSLFKSETGHEKGINTSTDPSQKSRVMMGTSKAGSTLPGHANDPVQKIADENEAKTKHAAVLSEMKQMPKPKLPMEKAEMGPEWEAKRVGLLHAKGAAESKKNAAHEKLVGPMNLKQYTTHIMGKKHNEYTVPKSPKHEQNLKDFHVANEEHKNASKAYKEHMVGDASDMHKSEEMNKKYEGFKAVEASAAKSGASDPAAVAAAVGRKKYGKEAFQHAAAEGKKMKKDESNSDEKEDAKLGEKVEHDVNQHQEENKEAEQKEGNVKGHFKLAKFIGYMEGKRGKMGAQGPTGGVLENQSHEQEMSDSGNNEPTKKVDQVGPDASSPKKLN